MVEALAYGLDNVAALLNKGEYATALDVLRFDSDPYNPLQVLAVQAWREVKKAQNGARGRMLRFDEVRQWFDEVASEMWRRGRQKGQHGLDCAIYGGQIPSGSDTFTARCSGVEWSEQTIKGRRDRLPCLGRIRTYRPYGLLRFLPPDKKRHRKYVVRCLDWMEVYADENTSEYRYWRRKVTGYTMTEVPK